VCSVRGVARFWRFSIETPPAVICEEQMTSGSSLYCIIYYYNIMCCVLCHLNRANKKGDDRCLLKRFIFFRVRPVVHRLRANIGAAWSSRRSTRRRLYSCSCREIVSVCAYAYNVVYCRYLGIYTCWGAKNQRPLTGYTKTHHRTMTRILYRRNYYLDIYNNNKKKNSNICVLCTCLRVMNDIFQNKHNHKPVADMTL